MHERCDVAHLKVSGKGGKTRNIPLHPAAGGLVLDYLEASGHGFDLAGALFRPIRNNRTGTLLTAITADMIYKLVRTYSTALGFKIGAHALRATAATNALDHQATWLKCRNGWGATTLIYDHHHRKTRPEDSPTFKVR